MRVAVLVGGPRVPRWQLDLIRTLGGEPSVDLRRVAIAASPGRPPRLPAALRLQQRLDRRIQRAPVSTLEEADLAELPLAPVTLGVLPARAGFVLDPSAARALRSDAIDVAIDLVPRDLAAGDPGAAAGDDGDAVGPGFAIWSLRAGDEPWDPVAFGEWNARAEAIPLLLVARSPSGTRVIARSATAPHEYSLLLTRAAAAAAASGLLLGELRAWPRLPATAARHGADGDDRDARLGPAHDGVRRPSGGESLRSLSRYVARLARKAATSQLVDSYHWTVAVARRPSSTWTGMGTGMGAGTGSLAGELKGLSFRTLDQPADAFHGDPFLWSHEGSDYLFLESFRYSSGRGAILAARLDAGGNPGPFTPVLATDSHLSYPFLVSWRGELFMIPEQCDARTVALYRCERFPDRWVRDGTLLSGVPAVDSTVVEWEGRLWLFTGVMAAPGIAVDTVQLCLFHAGDLRGPWIPHRLNPIVTDVRRARPAGGLFLDGGRLIRPAQDSSRRYGWAISLNHVTRLTPDEFEEREVGRFLPGDCTFQPRATGVHTLSASERFVAIDCCVTAFRGWRWLGRRRPGLTP